MSKYQLLMELKKAMDAYKYRLYPRSWVIVMAGMAWDRMIKVEGEAEIDRLYRETREREEADGQ